MIAVPERGRACPIKHMGDDGGQKQGQGGIAGVIIALATLAGIIITALSANHIWPFDRVPAEGTQSNTTTQTPLPAASETIETAGPSDDDATVIAASALDTSSPEDLLASSSPVEEAGEAGR